MKSEDTNIMLLCNFDENYNEEPENIKKLWLGKWLIEDIYTYKEIIATELETEALINLLKKYRDQDICTNKILDIAIKSLLTFCDVNWNSHPDNLNLEEYLGMKWPESIDVSVKLQKDSEPIFINILYPELLYLSSQVFNALYTVEGDLLHLWWSFRAKVVHQRILEDTSASLYSDLELLIAKLSNELQSLQDKPRLQILLCLEIAQAYLLYARVYKIEEYLLKARDLAGLKLELTGILGKRTKFQQKSLPQLALSSELDSEVDRPSAEESHGASELPLDIELQDDVRLDKIQYNEAINQADLPSLEQTLCLLTVQYLQKAQPKDDLATEEIQPYITAVLSQNKGPWATRVAALLIRCKLEANHKRTVERSMLQCEAIVNDKTCVSPTSRLSYLWASGLQPSWTWRQQLAELYGSLGLVKAALHEYERLQLWEHVCECYTMLQLRHKAAEIIKQQIDINPTVKLYCLLGDATDDISCYEKAWQFSGERSSRAQRQWGDHLFRRKQYEDSIPHYEKSLEINSIQDCVWMRLGYAALSCEQWDTSARAYRRYTYLQPHSFEAWNNLAKVYVHQGDKLRAYRALMEALKFNYDNWKLWENVIIVSLDTGHFEDVIRGVHRMLDLRSKYEDTEVQAVLVRAIAEDQKDADGNGAGRLRKRALELFGRLTSAHAHAPLSWQLYSALSATYLLKAQRLLRAYRGFTQTGNWSNDPNTCKKVIEVVQDMLDFSLKARKECEDKDKLQCDQQLSSARLTGQAVIRAVEKQDWPETKESLKELKVMFSDVTEYMKSII
ncbi:tetratricopeptide repeat protein 27 [Plodia interpunctella]|uniref:tetratricopeptide repeat protein 27 n=1 Tax=Plodia interpunctella TaxID=58824 RepID=UPI002367B6E4|nr:tetratricopeptide repeat protein 27 [Plodia interpunctella]